MRHHKTAQSEITLESVGGREWWKPPTDARWLKLAKSAFEIIAGSGLEGLRTRAVAERAGINIATLHYYFPSKETLVAGVACYLASMFVSEHAPPVVPSSSSALDRLRQEFADLRYYITERPDMTAVIQEFNLRARRDPLMAELLGQLNGAWRAGLQQMASAGIADGTFRAELDPTTIVDLLHATITGAMIAGFTGAPLERLCQQLESLLRGPDRVHSTSGTQVKQK